MWPLRVQTPFEVQRRMPWPTLIERAGQTRTAGGYWLDELIAEGSVQVETATGSEDLPWNIAWGSVETPDKLCSCMQECCDKLVCLPEVCDPATQWKYLDSQTMLTRVSAPCGKTPRNDLWFQNIARKERCIPAGLCVLNLCITSPWRCCPGQKRTMAPCWAAPSSSAMLRIKTRWRLLWSLVM